MDNTTKNHLVSIVIPRIKNDIHILECIDHIKMSSYQNYELLIINEGLERSAQRNIGIRKAKGKYILWLDSDMMISPMLIEDCVKNIQGHISVYLPERIITKGWFGKLRNWERQFYTGTLVDVPRFIRRVDCPLFDEDLHGPEDSSWDRECPVGPRAICSFSFDHHDKIGLFGYLKKKIYYAKSHHRYMQKHPDDKLLKFRYRCFEVFAENGKWKKFISNPFMAFGVMLLVLARGVIILTVK